MLPTEQPCSFVRRGERPQCVGELLKKSILPSPTSECWLIEAAVAWSRTYHPRRRAPAPRGTATQSRRGNTNHRAAGALCMEGPSLIRNYHKMGKRKGAYPASSEAAAAGDPNPTARLVLALLLLLVIIAIAFVVWRRARNRGPHCARHPKPRA